MQHKIWNKGKIVGQKAPFTPSQIKLIKSILTADNNLRDLALFSVGIDTMLRASDLLSLTVDDVTDHQDNITEEFLIRQQKTKQGNLVMLSAYSQDVLLKWIKQANKLKCDYLFTGLTKCQDKAISTNHYRRLVKQWAVYARLNPNKYSTHSIRRSKASIVYEKTGNIEAVRQLLGQKSVTSTSHYLNISQKEALAIAKEIKL
jgi:integrase